MRPKLTFRNFLPRMMAALTGEFWTPDFPKRTPAEIRAVRNPIIKRVQSHLSEIGFTEHDATTSWRMGDVKVDIFEFYLLTPGDSRKWTAPMGSFILDPKCFFPAFPSQFGDIEHLEGAAPPGPVPAGWAQLRWKVLKGIEQTDIASKTIYGLDGEPDLLDRLATDIETVIDEKLVPFWSRFDDPAEVFRTFREDEVVHEFDRDGPLDIGWKDSHIRLFNLGFAALWQEDYELAISALTESHEKFRERRQASGLGIDAKYSAILACIERGIARAKERAAAQP